MADPTELARSRRIDDGFPVVVRLQGRRVLVVGGGVIALRKTEGLLAAGATVRVVSPEFVEGFVALDVERVQRRYEPADLDGAWLVMAATNDPLVQQQIFDECEARGVFCNAVDDPDRCSFVLPAVERRGSVIVAVSTQGRSPTLAKHLRDRLAAALPVDVDALADRLAAERRALQQQGISTEDVEWPNPLA